MGVEVTGSFDEPLEGLADADQSVLLAFIRAIRPPVRQPLPEWAEDNFVIPPEVGDNPGAYSFRLAPHWIEVLSCLDLRHWSNWVTVCKSAQLGWTLAETIFLFAIADQWPSPTMMVHPTIKAAQDWNREKLMPMMRASPVPVIKRMAKRRRPVADEAGESAQTVLYKPFPGGGWVLTGANSSADLSSKTARCGIKEEWDRWPADVDNQGDPDELFEARFISYHRSGRFKIAQGGTPDVLQSSRTWAAFLAGDQRRRFIKCPHCGHEQEMRFFPVSREDEPFRGGLRFNLEAPHQAHYVCEAAGCGGVIEEHEKEALFQERGPDNPDGAFWKAMRPGAGRQPSFYINALYSLVTTWDHMVAVFVRAKGDPQRLKGFWNLWLGLPWDDRGDVPAAEKLQERAEAYSIRTVPAGGLVVSAGADVQGNGIFYETIATGRDGQSWSIDYGFLPGNPPDPEDGCWTELERVYNRQYRTAGGKSIGIDLFLIDGGFGRAGVSEWVKKKPKAFAVRGEDGWYKPIVGAPRKEDVTIKGKKQRKSFEIWPIGTYALKSTFYANLRKEGPDPDTGAFPGGYCHFSLEHELEFFEQLTAESLVENTKARRRMRWKWEPHGPNHWHDCRVYATAALEHPRLRISGWDDAKWNRIEAARGGVEQGPQGDLLGLMTAPVEAPRPAVTSPAEPVATPKKRTQRLA